MTNTQGGKYDSTFPVLATTGMIVNPCPLLSREARRIHWAAHYGIVQQQQATKDTEIDPYRMKEPLPQGGIYDGRRIEVTWSLDYNCTRIRAAIKELHMHANEYTVNLVCGSIVNAALFIDYEQWRGNRTFPHPEAYFHENNGYGFRGYQHDFPIRLQGCIGIGERCFTAARCRGCRPHTLTVIHLHE